VQSGRLVNILEKFRFRKNKCCALPILRNADCTDPSSDLVPASAGTSIIRWSHVIKPEYKAAMNAIVPRQPALLLLMTNPVNTYTRSRHASRGLKAAIQLLLRLSRPDINMKGHIVGRCSFIAGTLLLWRARSTNADRCF
jgi:hypothetical protein